MPRGNFMLNKRQTNRNQKPRSSNESAVTPVHQTHSWLDSVWNFVSSDSRDDKRTPKEDKSKLEASISGPMLGASGQWSPSTLTALKILMSLRLTAAVWSPIGDCDEVYNYWEPLHLLLHGSGFQTWEYSPTFALRSYGFVGFYYLPAHLFRTLFPSTKVTTFYFVRCFAACLDAAAAAFLFKALRERVSINVARLYLLISAAGAGSFISAAAFLPSSFAATLGGTAAMGFWLGGSEFKAILCVAAAALVGWPFAAILGAPLVLDMIINRKRTKEFVFYSLVAGIIVIVPLVLVDSYFYGKFAAAPLNIVLYNVFGGGGGPNLYGTEPLSYYLANLILNWNVAAVAAALAAPILAAVTFFAFRGRRLMPLMFMQVGMWLWAVVFFAQPHKEERFMFPVYPLLAASAAVALDGGHRLLIIFCRNIVFKNKPINKQWFNANTPGNVLTIGFGLVFILASASRCAALYRNYYAPFHVYMAFNERLTAGHPEANKHPWRLCVGKEWHRYPSSFFLPQNTEVQFIRSEFRGILPKHFERRLAVPEVTRLVPTDMNDMNLEETSRYVDLDTCDYLIDLDDGEDASGPMEPNYSRMEDQWRVLNSSRFLISGKSNRLFRAFYVPLVGDGFCKFGAYNLLQNVKKKNMRKTG